MMVTIIDGDDEGDKSNNYDEYRRDDDNNYNDYNAVRLISKGNDKK